MTTNAKQKAPQYNTPVGTMIFPRITVPDTKFKAEGQYSTKLAIPSDHPAVAKIIEVVDKAAEAKLSEAKKEAKNPVEAKKWAINNRPYEAEVDKEGNETGRTVFKFARTASGVSKKDGKEWTAKVKLFDATGKVIADPASLQVWGGSEGVVRFELVPYAPNAKIGAGVSLKLVAVQITKLVSGGGSDNAEDYGFVAQPGGFSADDMVKPASNQTTEGDDSGSAEESDEF